MSEKGPEGKVAKIIRRGRSHLAGIVVSKTKKGGGFAYAPLLGEDKQIRLNPSPDRTLQVGDRVIIRILDWGTQKKECQGKCRPISVIFPTLPAISPLQSKNMELKKRRSLAKLWNRPWIWLKSHSQRDQRTGRSQRAGMFYD